MHNFTSAKFDRFSMGSRIDINWANRARRCALTVLPRPNIEKNICKKKRKFSLKKKREKNEVLRFYISVKRRKMHLT